MLSIIKYIMLSIYKKLVSKCLLNYKLRTDQMLRIVTCVIWSILKDRIVFILTKIKTVLYQEPAIARPSLFY